MRMLRTTKNTDSRLKKPRGRLVPATVACLTAAAIAGCLVGANAGDASQTPISATTEGTTGEVNHGVTVTVTLNATINDGGMAGSYRFEWEPHTPETTLEDAFPPASAGRDVTTAAQGVPGTTEPQRVSAVIELSTQYPEFAYRVVLEAGPERVFGRPSSFNTREAHDTLTEERRVRAKLEKEKIEQEKLEREKLEKEKLEMELTSCRVPSLKGLKLSNARRLLSRTHCGTLRVAGRQVARSSRIVSQSPRAHTVIRRTAKITVWLGSPNRAYAH